MAEATTVDSPGSVENSNASENDPVTVPQNEVVSPGPTYKSKIPTNNAARTRPMQSVTPSNVECNAPPGGQCSTGRRPPTRSGVSPTSVKKVLPPNVGTTTRRLLENQFNVKKKRYTSLKRELADKQKMALELYEEVTQLREKVIAFGGKDVGKLEDLKPPDSLPNKVPFILGDIGDSGNHAPPIINLTYTSISDESLEDLKKRLVDTPGKYQELLQDALKQYSSLANRLKGTKGSEEGMTDEQLLDQSDDLIVKGSILMTRMNELNATHETLVGEILTSLTDLSTECEGRRRQLKEIGNTDNLSQELRAQVITLQEELKGERERHGQVKDRRVQAEVQLQKARAKMRELETHVANDDARIQQLQTSLKNLESQMKQREQAMDQRTKDTQRTIKNSESLVAKVEKQRDSFESRLIELKEKMNEKESDAKATIKELKDRIELIHEEAQQERAKKREAEDTIVEMQQRYRQLEEKSQELCELTEQTKEITITDGNHSQNEVRLFNELQNARAEMEKQEEKIGQLQREKEEIIAVMHQAASQDDEDASSKEKLAAELVAKSNELQNMTMDFTRVQMAANLAQQKNSVLERQLTDIQNRLHAQSKEGGKAAWGAQTIELQQQMSDLRYNLAGALKHNEELETALTQKQLELEQRERVMREQSKFLRAREELLNLMKGKGQITTKDGYQETDEVSRQIAAKSGAIQELYVTLENKQMQVMRLEKMVKQMEDQQDRAQAQRTRLENRIAQLEVTLQEKNKDHRSRGFGIL